MELNRRKFLKNTALLSVGLAAGIEKAPAGIYHKPDLVGVDESLLPVVISTWDFGLLANETAWTSFRDDGSALDAVEEGVKVIEADPDNLSVGIGGLPDRDGIVTLDACIMDGQGRAGSVCALESIMHPVSVARRIMEKTPHVMLAGDGALQFALEEGFTKTELLTEKSKNAWLEWKKTSKYEPVINIENHDTIGMLAIDASGNIAGACTTSGLAFKMHGRVGDSPVIGAGLFVDNEAGAAVATGLGEYVLKSLTSFFTVELMRRGASPSEACAEAIRRITRKYPNYDEFQVGVIALNTNAITGSYAIHKGFNYALMQKNQNRLIESDYFKV